MPVLSPQLVLAAYARGYFPMADPLTGAVDWYDAAWRAVFLPGDAHVSHSLRRLLRQGRFEIAFNHDFGTVVRACAERPETWISEEILQAYMALHRAGYAHSVEAYCDGVLAGGLYGVALGGAFFGESMFHYVTDASKAAFAILCRRLDERGFVLHDAQFITPHLARLGARELPRRQYQALLRVALTRRCAFP